ncbi:MAG: hypothetical protein WBQ72_20465 [Terriglobales bacterium]
MTNLQQTTIDTSVYRKNLQPVVYVTGDVAGGEESPVYAIMKMSDAIDKIKLPDGHWVKQYKGTTMPERTDRFSMKWDGEWHITVEVFRDLGLAFADLASIAKISPRSYAERRLVWCPEPRMACPAISGCENVRFFCGGTVA